MHVVSDIVLAKDLCQLEESENCMLICESVFKDQFSFDCRLYMENLCRGTGRTTE